MISSMGFQSKSAPHFLRIYVLHVSFAFIKYQLQVYYLSVEHDPSLRICSIFQVYILPGTISIIFVWSQERKHFFMPLQNNSQRMTKNDKYVSNVLGCTMKCSEENLHICTRSCKAAIFRIMKQNLQMIAEISILGQSLICLAL